MSRLVDTSKRTDAIEIMDDFSIEGDNLRDALDKLAKINHLLGGNNVTIKGLAKLLERQTKENIITIIDIGCGGGDILRDIAKWGKKKGFIFELIGIDANIDAVRYARQLSNEFPNISYVCCDIFSEEFLNLKYDIAIATLFLHHLKDEEILSWLPKVLNVASIGLVVNDLNRNRLAYYLFKLITIPVKNKMIIEDGLTSVLRGFKKKDLVKYSKMIKLPYSINWKWAFRYLWIIRKANNLN